MVEAYPGFSTKHLRIYVNVHLEQTTTFLLLLYSNFKVRRFVVATSGGARFCLAFAEKLKILLVELQPSHTLPEAWVHLIPQHNCCTTNLELLFFDYRGP